MTTTALSVTGLTKRYGDRTVVDDLDLELPAGRRRRLRRPQRRRQDHDHGHAPRPRPARPPAPAPCSARSIDDPAAYLPRVGALIESPAFYPALTGAENLRVFATVGGHDPAASRRCSSTVGLDDRGDDRYRSYSLGMKQRLGIAAALLGDPELLILDEPANGLDPQGVREMRALIGAPGRHAAAPCSCRRTTSASSSRSATGSCSSTPAARSTRARPRDLLDGVAGGLAVVPAARPTTSAALRDAARRAAATTSSVDDDRLVVDVDGADVGDLAAAVNRAAFDAGIVLVELSPLRTTLEDRYLVDGARRCPMTRIIHAELLRLLRRRTVVIAAVGAAAVRRRWPRSPCSRRPSDGVAPSRRGGTTLAALAGHGGGTEAFAVGASFVGFFVFVTFIALHRRRVLRRHVPGPAAARPAPAAGDRRQARRHPASWPPASSPLAEVLHVRRCRSLVAPAQDIVDRRLVLARAASATPCRDYATVFAGVAGWAVFGTTLAVIFRSAPLALGVGFAWAGPFENIVVDSWKTGYRVFPGQVLASLIRGGTVELAMGRAAVTAAAYAAVAAVAALVLVSRRDVTA